MFDYRFLTKGRSLFFIIALSMALGGGLISPARAQEEGAKPEETAAPAAEAEKANAEKTPAANQGGAGDLLITPTRVVLDDKHRSADVTLANRGSKETTFRISLVKMRMLDDGRYEDVDDKNPAKPDENFADDVARYSPHQVTLKPGETQAVKFAMKGIGNMKPGEYRSHVLFRGEPDMSQGTDIEQTTGNDKKISVRLIPVYGITIPLIVRHGDLSVTAAIPEASVKGGKLNLTITRKGTESLFGDVEVKTGDKVVGLVRGIAVYVPNEKRTVQMDLTPPEGMSLAGKELSVVYREREEDGGKVLAEMKVRD